MSKLVPQSNREARRYRGLIDNIGRLGASALFPNDFEAYFVSLELTDSRGITERFITFPVAPKQISEMQPSLVNIKKSQNGVIAIDSDSFVPRDIEIKGDFGRNLRFALGQNIFQGGAISFVRKLLNGQLERPQFSPVVKSGFGYTKALEDICNESKKLDANGKPKRLYLYNPILGNNYLVKVKNFVHSQNISENMIPQYTLQLTAVAPFNLETRFNFDFSTSLNKLNDGIDNLAKGIKNKLKLVSKPKGGRFI